MSATSVRNRVADLLRPVVTATGYDLEDVVVTPAGKRRLLRVVVDRDGGVSLDDVAELSRAAAEALDASEVMGDTPYVLEVSSPGVDRPLTEPRHWRRAIGRLVRASLRDGGAVTGRVLAADERAVSLDTERGPATLSYPELVRGAVQVEFATAGRADEEAPA